MCRETYEHESGPQDIVNADKQCNVTSGRSRSLIMSGNPVIL